MTAASSAPSAIQVGAVEVTPEQRRVAFASIYNQSHGLGDPARTLLPEEYRPIPLSEALDILANDDSHHGDMHRARGLATLVASGVHERPQYRDRVNDFYNAHCRDELPDLARLCPHGTPPEEAGRKVHARLSPDKSPIRKRRLSVNYDSRVQLTKTEVTLELNKSLEELAEMSDPRAWSQCSDLFKHSYQVDAANGWGTGKPPPIIASEPLGCTWKSLFYESFELAYNSMQANVFDNILHCDYRVPRDQAGQVERIHLKYTIRRAICSRDLWLTRLGGIDIDFGEFTAERCDDGWASIVATKNVRFTPLDRGHPNFLLPHFFTDIQNAMVPSLMAYFAEEWVEKSVGCKLAPQTTAGNRTNAAARGASHA